MTTKTKCIGKTKTGKACPRYAVYTKDLLCQLHSDKLISKPSVVTITFCECGENHVGMEKMGIATNQGFTKQEIDDAVQWAKDNNLKTDVYTLHNLIDNPTEQEHAWVLVIRDYVKCLKLNDTKVHLELSDLEWDSKYFDVRRKRVLNKHARRNCCFGEHHQTADFENKKGTIYSFSEVPSLEVIRKSLSSSLGKKANNLLAEGNLYMDGTKNGIGYHGDSERRIVVGFRFSSVKQTPPLYYRWYKESKIISEVLSVPLNSGDMYIMSHKAVGTDWKKKKIRTLRHATGANKYTK
jgi:hypothetical protein